MIRCLALFLLFITATSGALAQNLDQIYNLGSGDRVRVTVFGQTELSGEFEIGSGGAIAMPLIGLVMAGGLSVVELQTRIRDLLLDGYLRDPQVSIEVLNYRPFYILGEVNAPGSYPYVAGMTVLNAVALADGYTYRADEDEVFLKRANTTNEVVVNDQTVVFPGDIIRVDERFF